MTTALKLGLLGTCCAAGATGAGLAATHFGGSSSMPPFRFLFDDNSGTTDIYKDKYAANYKKYLVGVGTAATGKQPENNDLWWQWSFLNRYSATDAKGGFESSKVSKWEQLKTACENAYKGTKDTDSSNPTKINEGSDKYNEDEIWKYCSPYRTKVKTIEEVAKEKNNIEIYKGKVGDTYKSALVSSLGNDWFWNLKQKEFKEHEGWEEVSSGQNLFKEMHESIKKNPGTKGTVKEACESVYGQEDNTITNIKKYVFQFCSLSGQVPNSAG